MNKLSYYLIPFFFVYTTTSFGSLARISQGKIRDALQLIKELENLDDTSCVHKIKIICPERSEGLCKSVKAYKDFCQDTTLQKKERNSKGIEAFKQLFYCLGWGAASYAAYRTCKHLFNQEGTNINIFMIPALIGCGCVYMSIGSAQKSYGKGWQYINHSKSVNTRLHKINLFEKIYPLQST